MKGGKTELKANIFETFEAKKVGSKKKKKIKVRDNVGSETKMEAKQS